MSGTPEIAHRPRFIPLSAEFIHVELLNLSMQHRQSPERMSHQVTGGSVSQIILDDFHLQSHLPHPSVRSPIKRSLDIVGSLVGLFVLTLLFLPIAIAIKLDTSGPILYVQERCGFRGRRFNIYKFRTMVTGADALRHLVSNEADGPIFKNKEDPRVTRVGKFLRRTSLDELPQFWNVLVGDMSLVGTRPPLTEEVARYEARHWLRLNVKPGLTGEWQVSGRSSIKSFEEILALDLRYQEKWSFSYDLSIILKTLMVVLKMSSAY